MHHRLVFAILLVCVPGLPQCVSTPSGRPQGPVRKYSGLYRNLSYGFSTVIPRGYVGSDALNSDYQKGFAIVFRGGTASLNVYSDVNSLEYENSRAAAEADLADRNGRRIEIISSELQPARLGGQPADTLPVRYVCTPGGPEFLWVETVALSPDRGYVYTVSWEGASSQFSVDLAVVTGLTRSWRFLEPK